MLQCLNYANIAIRQNIISRLLVFSDDANFDQLFGLFYLRN